MSKPITRTAPSRHRLAAIDLDGTLLSADLSISRANRAAVESLPAHGIEVAIASGRHYASIRPYVDQLPAVRWVVSAQGAEVADRDRKLVLHRQFLAPAKVEEALDRAAERRISNVVYAPPGVFTTGPGDPSLTFYRRLGGVKPIRISQADALKLDVFKVVWLGTKARITSIVGEGRFMTGLEIIRTHARIVEFIPSHVSKAAGLNALASHLGITRKQVVVFGDADNDIPMFLWAGQSVAMPGGWPSAIAKATHVGPAGPADTALARAIAMVLGGKGGARQSRAR